MIQWLRTRLWQRSRKIFRFHDGTRLRAVDPLLAAIALQEHDEYLPRHLKEAFNGDADARRIVITAACDAFGVKPLSTDGKRGLTAAECIELMVGFDAYLAALKKNTRSPQISPTSTDATSPMSNEPTTNDSSDSG